MVVTGRSQTKRNDKAPPPATPPLAILPKRQDFHSPSPLKRHPQGQGKEDPYVASPVPSIDSTGSGSSSRQRSQLPNCLLKQLAQDIETCRGIQAFTGTVCAQNLSKLCDQREDLYGKRGGTLRGKITKKVIRWKLLEDQGKYTTKVLNRLGIKSFQNIQAEERKKKKAVPAVGSRKKSVEESLADLSVSSSSSDDDSSISSSTDSLPSAVISFKRIHTKTDKNIDFLLERPVVRTTSEKKEETTMNKGIPRDCGEYLFRFRCV